MQHTDNRPQPDTAEPSGIPAYLVRLVYAWLGFSPVHTAILDYRAPYVLLVTATREHDPYSVVSLDTGRTVERFTRADAATARLHDLQMRLGR